MMQPCCRQADVRSPVAGCDQRQFTTASILLASVGSKRHGSRSLVVVHVDFSADADDIEFTPKEMIKWMGWHQGFKIPRVKKKFKNSADHSVGSEFYKLVDFR
jgi:hypothetical protein